jgi:hypothetical protein
MRDTIATLFIQCGFRTNPDEVGEALNDDFVCKDSPKHSKPRATAGEKERGAAGVVPDGAVLWVKGFESQLNRDSERAHIILSPKSNHR